MIEPRILKETGEISLYELLGIAMAEGLDLREVVVSYAGCGSHGVLVTSMEEAAPPPRKLVPEEDAYDELPRYGWGGEEDRDFGIMYRPGDDKLTLSVVRDGIVDEEDD